MRKNQIARLVTFSPILLVSIPDMAPWITAQNIEICDEVAELGNCCWLMISVTNPTIGFSYVTYVSEAGKHKRKHPSSCYESRFLARSFQTMVVGFRKWQLKLASVIWTRWWKICPTLVSQSFWACGSACLEMTGSKSIWGQTANRLYFALEESPWMLGPVSYTHLTLPTIYSV